MRLELEKEEISQSEKEEVVSCERGRLKEFIENELGRKGDEVKGLFEVLDESCGGETKDIWTYKCRYKDANRGEIPQEFRLCDSCKRLIRRSGICV